MENAPDWLTLFMSSFAVFGAYHVFLYVTAMAGKIVRGRYYIKFLKEFVIVFIIILIYAPISALYSTSTITTLLSFISCLALSIFALRWLIILSKIYNDEYEGKTFVRIRPVSNKPEISRQREGGANG